MISKMDNRLLTLAIFITLSACLHQGYGTTIVKRGVAEAFGSDVVIENSQSLIEDELQYERRGAWRHEDDDNDDEDSYDDDDDDDNDNGDSEDSDDDDDDVDVDDYSEDNDDESVSVEFDSGSDEPSENSLERVKRTTFNNKKFIWPNKIPYVIDFTSVERRYRLRKVLDHLETRLCVKFYNEEERLNKSNPNWLRELGYETDSYMFFRNGKGCWAMYGQGNKGARTIVACHAYISMLHETLHSLGGHHAQKFPLRDKYITLHNANIYERRRSQYSRTPIQDRITHSYFDSASLILYGNHFFSSGGPTYDFVRPEMGKLSGMRSIKTLMYEMTQNYKCRETFCSHVTKDCGPGYLTFLKDECVCVCPDHYDPNTNCTTLVDRVQSPSSWPDTPFSLYKTHDPCPDGFSEGTIPLKGKSIPKQTGVPLDIEGRFLKIRVCTRTTPVSKGKWEEWPLGSYCIGKVKDTSCALPFEETTFNMKVAGVPKPLKGSVGDVRIIGREVIIKFCCNQQAATRIPIELPNTQSFRLLKAEGSCQEVNGMFSIETSITTKTKTKLSGYKPDHHIVKNSFTHSSCLYIPPVYGCNRIFKLTPDHTSVTFSIPTKNSLREGSRRCFFAFEAPAQTRLRLSFDKFNLHPQDKFFVKRFHPWTNHYRVPSDSPPGQMITERNYLFVESWTHFEEDKKYTGADLTVDLLPDSERCYTSSTQGADYAGDKNVTELYEDCVAWKDATTCPDFPWKYSMTLLSSGNKCRNLDTRNMLQPWCYSHVDDKVCIRRYCDVCNEMAPMDRVAGCQKMIDANKLACSDPYFKNGCFVSCGESTQPYAKNTFKCSRPDIPTEFDVQDFLQDSYAVGSSVKVTCQGIDTNIECTSHGWTPFADSCTDNACLDASQSCQETLTTFPEFCTHAKSTDVASQLCKKSCGVCQAGTCGASEGATYTVLSPSGGQVTTGHYATFSCHDGKTHMSGELKRACSVAGNLLGEEPHCEDQQMVSFEINGNSIREQYITDKFPSRTALLMLSQEFRIPFDGKITHWFSYCRDNEDVYLLVYRETDRPNVYEQVGKNKATCVKGLPWTYLVPSDERVAVKKGDVIGVFQSTVSFAHTECGGVQAPVVMTKKMQSSDLSQPSATFPKKLCLRVPIGARVEPLTM